MQLRSKNLFVQAFALLLAALIFAVGAEAQITELPPPPGKNRGGGRPTIKVVTKTVVRNVHDTLLIVTAEPNAIITLIADE